MSENIVRCKGCGIWLPIFDLTCSCWTYGKIDRPKTNEGSVRNDINQQRKGKPMKTANRGEIG